MGFIPRVMPPLPDELLYSWIWRMAEDNEVSFNVFLKNYIYGVDCYYSELPYEIRDEYTSLCQHMYFKRKLSKVYLEHSTFPFESIFMSTGDRIRYARKIAYNTDGINVPMPRFINDIFICPECMKEDIENYDIPILKTYHHLRGVKTCYKHNVPLWKYKGKKGYACRYNMAHYEELHTEPYTDIYTEYSKFAYALLKMNLNVSVDQLKCCIKEHLNKQGYSLQEGHYDLFKEKFLESKYSVLLEKDFDLIVENYLLKKKTIRPEDLIPFLMFTFKDPEILCELVNNKTPLIEDDNCPECNDIYIKINYSDTHNLCPDCYSKLPMNTKFKRLIDEIGNNEYDVLDPFLSMNTRVRMLHKPCNTESSFLPRYFIYQYSRCPVCTKEHLDEWNKWFKLLLKYKEEHGDVNVLKSYVDSEGNKLGQWVVSTRINYNKGKLSEFKVNQLKELGFDFHPFKNVWDKKIACYREYVEETGNFHVQYDVVYKDFKLGTWYNNLKKKYTNNKLSDSKLKEIREIYPAFPDIPVIEKSVESEEPKQKHFKFKEIISLMLEYKSEYGDLLIPKRFKVNDYNLGAYVQQVRDKYKRGILSEDYINRLNEIGFIWNAEDFIWNSHIDRYRRYVNETGNKVVPRSAVYEDYPIGTWYANTKAAKTKGFITEKQLQDMTNIYPDF